MRHQRHRSEIKSAADGLGEHFYDHAVELGLNLKNSKDFDTLMNHLNITIIASVEPGRKYSQDHLDRLETDLQHRLMTMSVHGGMNRRDEIKRTRRGGQ